MTTSVCIKVANLRKLKYKSLKDWLDNKNNLYVGRRGRIFIKENNESNIFHYKESKWANPYPVKGDMTLKKSLTLYIKHLITTKKIKDIYELEGKTLGCFCDVHEKNNIPTCHARVLVHLLTKCRYIIDSFKF